jgi:dTDP-4-amino-4,6-dideoxygalactose transaminase
MEEIQAAVLNVKLRHLDDWNDRRRARAARYNSALSNSSLVLPQEMAYARHVYHVYVVQSDNREGLQKHLTTAGVQTGVHYPIPIHLQPAYAPLGYKRGDLPVTESLAERVLSLPMFPELSDEQIDRVAQAVIAEG